MAAIATACRIATAGRRRWTLMSLRMGLRTVVLGNVLFDEFGTTV